MEEIKFRIPVVCQNGHKSHAFYKLDWKDNPKIIQIVNNHNPNCDCPKYAFMNWREVGPEELCSNLEDKNGKEIYSEDIVRQLPTMEGEVEIIKKVEFLNGRFNAGECPLHFNINCHNRNAWWEIIGNNHENPELLTHVK